MGVCIVVGSVLCKNVAEVGESLRAEALLGA
jgi:hypothetical protein